MRLLDGVPESEARRLLTQCRRRRFAAREVIFHEGDLAESLYLIERGRVAVRVATLEGHSATVDLLGAGDPLGELALLPSGGRRSATAIALVATETMELGASPFAVIREQYPSMTEVLLGLVTERNRALNARLLEALYVPAEKRIVRRLLDYAARFGEGPQPVVLLTQEDLSGLAGTTRETVNRTLGQLAEGGLVELTRGRIALLDRPGLDRRAR